ncbi:MAG: biotin--[acetyl-CoA-carboxylase] ligase [Flavisolibacter sp.]|nr:biotin--[acetyl-CoA-carboxylase] ligase [Flavisolibacter sp.]
MPFTPTIGIPFIELQQAESTNNYAIGAIHAGMAQHGTAVFAHHQTAGKGQRDKRWYGDANKNIALSIIIKPEGLSLSQTFLLSMATAVGVYNFLKSYAGDEIKIKWPNDIYWRDRKTAGILIENIVQGFNWKWSIIGIGVNINQTAFDNVAIKAVSLKQITGKDFEPVQLAKELCTFLENAFDTLHQSGETIIDAYKKNLFRLGETGTFRKEGRAFTGTITDVTTYGQLVVQGAVEEKFNVGEIEWVI